MVKHVNLEGILLTNKDDFWDALHAEIIPAVKRFEEMMKLNKFHYFDTETLEEIYSYYFGCGEIGSALKVADYGIAQNPFSASFYLKKSQALLAKGKFADAKHFIEKAQAYEPNSFEVMLGLAAICELESNIDKALYYLEKATTLAGDEFLVVYNAFANLLMAHDRYAEAQLWLEKILWNEPEDEEAVHDLNLCYHQLGKITEGIEFFNKFIDKHPYHANAWFALGSLYNLDETFDSALRAFDFATMIDDQHTLAWFNWGNVYVNLGDYNAALSKFLEAHHIEPENAFVTCGMAVCYENLDDTTNAIHWYKITCKLDSEMSDGFFGLGCCYNKVGEWELAYHNLKTALTIEPENAEYWHQLGECYFGQSRFDEASEAYDKALTIDPTYEDAMFDLVFTKLNFLDKLAEAIFEFDLCKSSIPPTASFYYKSAAFYFAVNNHVAGMEELEQGLIANFSEHDLLFEWCPETETNSKILNLIDTYRI